MRRRHGGRRAQMRGTERVGQDFAMLCAAVNAERLPRAAVADKSRGDLTVAPAHGISVHTELPSAVGASGDKTVATTGISRLDDSEIFP